MSQQKGHAKGVIDLHNLQDESARLRRKEAWRTLRNYSLIAENVRNVGYDSISRGIHYVLRKLAHL
ncbi:hypothetical protein X798_03945 [Onchocerca flexuosa]|uniref:Uncharacterized protein n=1 Tax=Onchocerca flexuosa TaxID=387005 RepID=A0A238BWA8_9BILA|nr:hypothetical protein X798_03945 [Onchocerca flexuosa]